MSNLFERNKTPIMLAGSCILIEAMVYWFLKPLTYMPMYIPGMLLVATLWLIFGLLWYYKDNQTYNPEGAIFKTARKLGYPVLQMWALNGFFKFILGEKEKRGDILFSYDKESREGIRVDPRIHSSYVPKCFTIGGLEVYEFATNSPFALGPKNAIAMKTIIDHIRANYDILKFFSDEIILEYTSRSRADLPHDCKNLAEAQNIEVYPSEDDLEDYKASVEKQVEDELQKQGREISPEEKEEAIDSEWESRKASYILAYRANYLANVFIRIQDDVSKMPLDMTDHKMWSKDGKIGLSGKFFSFAEAFQNITSGVTAMDLQTILQLFESIASKRNELEMKWLVSILVGAGIFIVLAVIGYSIVKSATGG